MSCWSGILKSTGVFVSSSGVLGAERAEGLAGHVSGELHVAETEDGAPELQDAADAVLSQVAVLVAGLGDGAEEVAAFEVAVFVEVLEALRARQLGLAEPQLVVALFLLLRVPEEEVVGAVGVLGLVASLAATAHRVADFPVASLVVGDVVEHELGAVVPVAVVVVLEVDDAPVQDVVRVLLVPAAQDEARGEGLVAEVEEVEVARVVVHRGHQNLLDVRERQGLGALALVVAPLLFALQPRQDVEDRGVLLSKVLVHRRLPVVREDVVDVAAALGDVRLGPILPALHDELLEVVVGDVLLVRDEALLGGRPALGARRSREKTVDLGELSSVHRDLPVQHR